MVKIQFLIHFRLEEAILYGNVAQEPRWCGGSLELGLSSNTDEQLLMILEQLEGELPLLGGGGGGRGDNDISTKNRSLLIHRKKGHQTRYIPPHLIQAQDLPTTDLPPHLIDQASVLPGQTLPSSPLLEPFKVVICVKSNGWVLHMTIVASTAFTI